MNVNPLILVAAGTVVVGIASIAICAKPAKKDTSSAKKKTSTSAAASAAPAHVVEHTSAPTAAAAAAAAEVAAPAAKKGKKKVRSNKKKKSASTESGPDEESSEEEPVKVPEVAAKKAEPVKPTPAKAVAAHEPAQPDSDDEEFSMYTNKSGAPAQPKKAKKAKETPEQKAARVERQKAREAEKAAEELMFVAEVDNAAVAAAAVAGQPDGWSVIEVKKPKKREDESASPVPEPTPAPVAVAAPEPVVPAGPVVETITTPVTVDSKKIGLLIGPKGATKMGIQNLTGATIEMPKTEKDAAPAQVVVNVTGTAPAVAKAVHALNELCLKGYATLLAGDDFQEGYVAIHPRFLPDVIGKAGTVIRALQTHTGVKITTPANSAKTDGTPASKIKIGLAGPREKVTEARNLIKEITKYYHTSVTHPGVVHTEMDIPANYYNYIIGSKGSEIKHIQNSFKVSVYIPNADSNNSNVLLVGEPSAVSAAEKHIHKLIEKVDTMAAQRAEQDAANAAFKAANAAARDAARAAAQSAGGAPAGASYVGAGGRPSTAKVDKDDEPQEEWMKEFAPRGPGINLGDILPSDKFTASNADASA